MDDRIVGDDNPFAAPFGVEQQPDGSLTFQPDERKALASVRRGLWHFLYGSLGFHGLAWAISLGAPAIGRLGGLVQLRLIAAVLSLEILFAIISWVGIFFVSFAPRATRTRALSFLAIALQGPQAVLLAAILFAIAASYPLDTIEEQKIVPQRLHGASMLCFLIVVGRIAAYVKDDFVRRLAQSTYWIGFTSSLVMLFAFELVYMNGGRPAVLARVLIGGALLAWAVATAMYAYAVIRLRRAVSV